MESKTKPSVPSGLIRHNEKRIASATLPLPTFDVESDKTQTESKRQARAELASLSQSVVSQTFTELGEMLSVPT